MITDQPLPEGEELSVQACYRLIKSLQESEARYRRLLDISIDGFWERDLASGTTYLSPRWKSLFGYADDDLPNTFETVVALIHPDDRDDVVSVIDAHLQDPGLYAIEFRAHHRHGHIVWVKMRGKTTFASDGSALFICGSAIDISQRKAVETALIESERRWKFALEGSAQGVWDWDLKAGTVYISPQWKTLLGFSNDDVQNSLSAWEQLIQPEDAARVKAALQRHLNGETGICEVEFRQLCRDGTYKWIQARGMVVEMDEAGRPTRMIGTHSDVHERKQAEARLRLAAAVIEHAKEAILTTDANNRIMAVNPAFTVITGYTPEEAVGKDPRFMSSGKQSRSFYRKMWQSLSRTGAWEGEVWNRRKNGEIYPQWLSLSLIRDADGHITHHIGIASDNTERKAVHERLEHLAHYDTLTRLPNRLLVRDRLQHALRAARRQNSTLALLFVDLDRFKIINDSLGHHVGDTLLQSVSERVLTCVREMDTVGRYGGDEFVIVLPEVDPQAAGLVAQRIVESVSAPYVLCHHELAIASSIGVAVYPFDGDDVDTLIQNADTAMYHAKQTGRATVRFFAREMNTSANRQLEMATGLRRAIKQGHFVLHYQPQVQLETGRIVAFEALIRWRTPQGMVMPSGFLPIAAQNGLIGQIDDWVLTTACLQAKAWQDSGLLRAKVAVNMSAGRLSEQGFADRLAEILQATRLEARYLELEIADRTTVESAEAAAGAIVALRNLGVSIAIDDFGTGYSSMSYLKFFRVDKLQIDRSIVAGLPADADAAAIADAIINLGKNMGQRVIAKGIENRAQLDYLQARGLKFAQGYLFGEPLPAEQFASCLEHGVAMNLVLNMPGPEVHPQTDIPFY